MTIPTITALPEIPAYSDANFETKAPAVLSALRNTFVAEMNAAIAAINSYDYGAAVNISKVVGLTAGYIPYGAGTSALASSANLTFVSNMLNLQNDSGAQFRLTDSTGNYTDFRTDSDGNLEIAPSGVELSTLSRFKPLSAMVVSSASFHLYPIQTGGTVGNTAVTFGNGEYITVTTPIHVNSVTYDISSAGKDYVVTVRKGHSKTGEIVFQLDIISSVIGEYRVPINLLLGVGDWTVMIKSADGGSISRRTGATGSYPKDFGSFSIVGSTSSSPLEDVYTKYFEVSSAELTEGDPVFPGVAAAAGAASGKYLRVKIGATFYKIALLADS